LGGNSVLTRWQRSFPFGSDHHGPLPVWIWWSSTCFCVCGSGLCKGWDGGSDFAGSATASLCRPYHTIFAFSAHPGEGPTLGSAGGYTNPCPSLHHTKDVPFGHSWLPSMSSAALVAPHRGLSPSHLVLPLGPPPLETLLLWNPAAVPRSGRVVAPPHRQLRHLFHGVCYSIDGRFWYT
jgi:hypothetical protein